MERAKNITVVRCAIFFKLIEYIMVAGQYFSAISNRVHKLNKIINFLRTALIFVLTSLMISVFFIPSSEKVTISPMPTEKTIQIALYNVEITNVSIGIPNMHPKRLPTQLRKKSRMIFMIFLFLPTHQEILPFLDAGWARQEIYSLSFLFLQVLF